MVVVLYNKVSPGFMLKACKAKKKKMSYQRQIRIYSKFYCTLCYVIKQKGVIS